MGKDLHHRMDRRIKSDAEFDTIRLPSLKAESHSKWANGLPLASRITP
jgi:hypothetical protein